jgi:hypothetical protein
MDKKQKEALVLAMLEKGESYGSTICTWIRVMSVFSSNATVRILLGIQNLPEGIASNR